MNTFKKIYFYLCYLIIIFKNKNNNFTLDKFINVVDNLNRDLKLNMYIAFLASWIVLFGLIAVFIIFIKISFS